MTASKTILSQQSLKLVILGKTQLELKALLLDLVCASNPICTIARTWHWYNKWDAAIINIIIYTRYLPVLTCQANICCETTHGLRNQTNVKTKYVLLKDMKHVMAQVTFEENIKEKMSNFVSFCVLCQCRVGSLPSIIYQGDTFSVWCCGIDPSVQLSLCFT